MSSLDNFSFNSIGKEPELLRRMAAPGPTYQYNNGEEENNSSPSPTSPASHRSWDTRHPDEPLSSGRPTLFQALFRGEPITPMAPDGMDVDQPQFEEAVQPAHATISRSSPTPLITSEPVTSTSVRPFPWTTTQFPSKGSSQPNGATSDSGDLLYPEDVATPSAALTPKPSSGFPTPAASQSSASASTSQSHPQIRHSSPGAVATSQLRSLHNRLVSLLSPANASQPVASGSNTPGPAGSHHVSNLLNVIDLTTKAQTLAQTSLESSRASLEASLQCLASAEASLASASQAKAKVEQAVQEMQGRENELKALLGEVDTSIREHERARDEVMGDIKYDVDEDEMQVLAREEEHLKRLRDEEDAAKQRTNRAEKTISEARSSREAVRKRQEELEKKRKEQMERQAAIERDRKKYAEERAARQRRIAELQQELAAEEAKQAEARKRQGEENEMMPQEGAGVGRPQEEDERRVRDEERRQKEAAGKRRKAEEDDARLEETNTRRQEEKDKQQKTDEQRSVPDAEHERLMVDRSLQGEERQLSISQQRLKDQEEANNRAQQQKERDVEEERKLREQLRQRKERESQQRVSVKREPVEEQPIQSVSQTTRVKLERNDSNVLPPATPQFKRHPTHPPIAVIKTSSSPTWSQGPSSVALPLLPSKPTVHLPNPPPAITSNPVAAQTLVPPTTKKMSKGERKRTRKQTVSGGVLLGKQVPAPANLTTAEELRAHQLGLRSPKPKPPSLPRRPDIGKGKANQNLHVDTRSSCSSTTSETPTLHSYDVANSGNLGVPTTYSPISPSVQLVNVRHLNGSASTTAGNQLAPDRTMEVQATNARPPSATRSVPMAVGPEQNSIAIPTPPPSGTGREQSGQQSSLNAQASQVPYNHVDAQRITSLISPDMALGDGGWSNAQRHGMNNEQNVTQKIERSLPSPTSSPPPLHQDYARTPPLPPPPPHHLQTAPIRSSSNPGLPPRAGLSQPQNNKKRAREPEERTREPRRDDSYRPRAHDVYYPSDDSHRRLLSRPRSRSPPPRIARYNRSPSPRYRHWSLSPSPPPPSLQARLRPQSYNDPPHPPPFRRQPPSAHQLPPNPTKPHADPSQQAAFNIHDRVSSSGSGSGSGGPALLERMQDPDMTKPPRKNSNNHQPQDHQNQNRGKRGGGVAGRKPPGGPNGRNLAQRIRPGGGSLMNRLGT